MFNIFCLYTIKTPITAANEVLIRMHGFSIQASDCSKTVTTLTAEAVDLRRIEVGNGSGQAAQVVDF